MTTSTEIIKKNSLCTQNHSIYELRNTLVFSSFTNPNKPIKKNSLSSL